MKALDVWFMVCLMFVFSAMLEFAYVNMTARVVKRRLSMRDAVQQVMEKEDLKVINVVQQVMNGKICTHVDGFTGTLHLITLLSCSHTFHICLILYVSYILSQKIIGS